MEETNNENKSFNYQLNMKSNEREATSNSVLKVSNKNSGQYVKKKQLTFSKNFLRRANKATARRVIFQWKTTRLPFQQNMYLQILLIFFRLIK